MFLDGLTVFCAIDDLPDETKFMQRTTKADAQADLCLYCSHMALTGFLMTWIIN